MTNKPNDVRASRELEACKHEFIYFGRSDLPRFCRICNSKEADGLAGSVAMPKTAIIAAIKELSQNPSFPPADRVAALEDIEHAAQEARENLEEQFDEE
ncbi:MULTISPECIES: hypothetical protein [Pseudomonas syringae group genomosp. 2]|uniref:Uncharacterized protein n=3 Tax=Pseudomonas syringae group genomosp. 2 TaxID=251698 RepID=A0AAX1VNT1_PSEAJ|nr:MULTISPECIES: hypothetical protein [Pseudomonas syringae group genomosp. 2]KPX59414.1 Unknown protein sequence [Pseudomonas amygdali pv. lachrymans]KEZ28227.1 hypothetical protein A3SK_0105790 [Pseudomonas amygdali pv. tabaci str. 6605]QOI04430.1 hypothetical protein D5S10_11440 [Pseudomonas savastanoi]RML76115.1 hypothetical protein ALQ89_00504 [Pseudomonas amygdali pv. tabaci]BCS45201.1 hypothetical protein Pta6605_35320 [Pseudomonas amygdali pv. tabaci]